MIVSKMTQEEKGYGRSYNLYRNFLTWTFVQVFPKQIKVTRNIFSYGFSRRVNSIGFYNKIILRRKDLTVNSRINDCAISVD